MGNILFRMPEMDFRSPEDFGQPSTGKVTRRDGQPSGQGVPDYLVEPIELSSLFSNDFSEVQLIDFGECKPAVSVKIICS
jgi:hypothetical protein